MTNYREHPWIIGDRMNMPHESGLYLFCLDDKPVYVGASGNLKRRFGAHNSSIQRGIINKHDIGDASKLSVFYRLAMPSELADMEHSLITELSPPFNLGTYRSGNPFEYKYPHGIQIRLDDEDSELLHSLSMHLRLSKSNIIRIAVRRMHEFELLHGER